MVKHWQGFDVGLVEKEIAENRQWKIIKNNEVVCVFAITYNDPIIWEEKDKDSAVYIHRIVTHPNYRGNNYVKNIVAWAHIFCKQKEIDFIRYLGR
ncbi:MAG: hypothetical protein ABL929_03725 [Ferruginibacter sp.]|nr:hypothetical protein [Ferruginibacter sp.]